VAAMETSRRTRVPFGASRLALAVALVLGIAMVAGCGEKKKDKDKPSSVAAKVNREEVSTQQIDFVLQQQRGLKPEQVDAASRQILERLIDQELAVEQADELKLDREPRVKQQLEAARREVLARAYVDHVGEAAAKPTADEVRKYYDEKPALFNQRRIYNLQEIAIEARPDQIEALRRQLESSKSVNEFAEYLKAHDFRFGGNQATRAAEQLPLNMLDAISSLKDGEAMLLPGANGAQAVFVVGSRPAPVELDAARPVIEQYLTIERRRELALAKMKDLRASAKIEYVGRFAPGAASAPGPIASEAARDAGLK
jgi:EpsD family peptidyl-prolyl cis-trans isomerase